eukprot:4611073-Pyramimonas_sp.AAC.1
MRRRYKEEEKQTREREWGGGRTGRERATHETQISHARSCHIRNCTNQSPLVDVSQPRPRWTRNSGAQRLPADLSLTPPSDSKSCDPVCRDDT